MSLAAFGIGAGVSGLAGLTQGALNYSMSKKQLKWAKHVQKETWKREDTAAQRRAADLKAAGLSKTLAAGASASSGPVVQTQAPKMEGLPESVTNAYNLLTMGAQYTRTQAEIKNIAQQIKTGMAQEQKFKMDAFKTGQQGLLEQHDVKVMEGKPFLYRNPSHLGSITRDLVNAGKPASDAIRHSGKKATSWYMKNIGLPFEKKVKAGYNYIFGKKSKGGQK